MADDLIEAAQNGDVQRVKDLLASGVSVETKENETGGTVLQWAACKGHTEIVQVLLQNGAKIDRADMYGHTALICAANNGRYDTVELLVNEGANVNRVSHHGSAIACAEERGFKAVADFLRNVPARDPRKDAEILKQQLQDELAQAIAEINAKKAKAIQSAVVLQADIPAKRPICPKPGK